MDWTSIYAETGDEELVLQPLLPCTQKLRESRLARLVSVVYFEEDSKFSKNENILEPANRSRYNLLALYFLSINYILGVGCLGVPFAFARAGLILGSSLIVLISIISFITVMWIAECGEVAEFLTRYSKNDESTENKKQESGSIMKGYSNGENESSYLLQRVPSNSPLAQSEYKEDEHYEVIELISRFLGPSHQIIYQISLMGLMYIGLLAYSQVFMGCISTLLPEGTTNLIPTLIFSIIVIPLSCIELDEQITLQAMMAAIRFFAIFVMIGQSFIALCVNNSGINRKVTFPYFAKPDLDEMSYTANFNGFGIAFSTALFSQLFQHSVPGLLKPLKDVKRDGSSKGVFKIDTKDLRHSVPKTFAAALITTATLYLLLGCIAASYFGASTNPSVNLNFVNFDYGQSSMSSSENDFRNITTEFLSSLVSRIIVFFPALDTLSVFPLIANTLGNNLLASTGETSSSLPLWIDEQILNTIYAPLTPTSPTALRSKRRHISARCTTILFRLIASIPPLWLSLYATDLSFSLQLAGLCGLYVAFFAPVLLYIRSSQKLRKAGHSFQSIYYGWWSSEIFCIPILLFAIFSLGNVSFHIIKICMKA